MKVRLIIFLVALTSGLVAFSQQVTYVSSYAIGETNVMVHERKFGATTREVTLINLHDNEQTSLKAAESYLESCGGGTLVRLSNQQERFVEFTMWGKTYRFDPNRIYSLEGRRTTLKKLSGELNLNAQDEVGYLAKKILHAHLGSSKLIVAIHNNTDSALSVTSYWQDQADKKHFGKVFINPEMDPDDFILTTDLSIFKKIRDRNINVIWENSELIEDDGSLSVYAGKHKIPYINIEAQHDHLDEQLSMLNAIDEIVKEYGQLKPVRGIASKDVARKSLQAFAKGN